MALEFTDSQTRSDVSPPTLRRPALAAVGGVLGGIAAMSCCVLPLAFVLIGVSGAWIGNLTALSPWQPAFIAVAIAFIGYGHWSAYQARRACAAGSQCARPLPRHMIDAGLWTGTVFVAAGAAVAYLMPLLIPAE